MRRGEELGLLPDYGSFERIRLLPRRHDGPSGPNREPAGQQWAGVSVATVAALNLNTVHVPVAIWELPAWTEAAEVSADHFVVAILASSSSGGLHVASSA